MKKIIIIIFLILIAGASHATTLREQGFSPTLTSPSVLNLTVNGSNFSVGGTTINTVAGNVGINITASPTAKLDILGPGSGNGINLRTWGDMMLGAAAGSSLYFDGNYSAGTGSYYKSFAANQQAIYTAGLLRVHVGPSTTIESSATVKGDMSVGDKTNSATLKINAGTELDSRLELYSNSLIGVLNGETNAGTLYLSKTADASLGIKFEGDNTLTIGNPRMTLGGIFRANAASYLLGATTVESSVTIKGANGLGVTYGISAASITASVNGDVNVSKYVTGGTGATNNPWTGWDTAIVWTASTTYFFPKGTFSYATAPNWLLRNITIKGASQQGTVLKHTGSGNAVEVAGGTVTVVGGFGFTMSDLRITGNANTLNGIFVRNAHQIFIKNVSVNNVSAAAFLSSYSIVGLLENFQCDVNAGLGNPDVTPSSGIVLSGQSVTGSGPTNAYVIINPVITGLRYSGIWFDNAGANLVLGGQVESNGSAFNDYNVYASTLSENNRFINVYNNGGLEDTGNRNEYHGGVGGAVKLTGSSYTKFFGGSYPSILIDATSSDNQFNGTSYTGTFTDNGTRTLKLNMFQSSASSATHRNSSIGAGLDVIGNSSFGGAMTVKSSVTIDLGTANQPAMLVVAGSTQAIFYGWTDKSLTKLSNDNGQIRFGQSRTNSGMISYDGAVEGALHIDNTNNDATAPIRFRVRTSGTPLEALTIQGTGNVSVGVGGTLLAIISTGSYTPALTNGTNVAASTVYALQYYRIGNLIHVFGMVDIDPTSAGASSEIDFSLPIASALTADGDVAGSASSTTGDGGAVFADTVNDRMQIMFVPSSTANVAWTFTFAYVVK